jgi:7,8-dihydroneopterin aldolase/epimerase/oxygenase
MPIIIKFAIQLMLINEIVMNVIGLENICVNAPIGMYREERKIASSFSIDVDIKINLDMDKLNDNIDNTIDYEVVYKIVTSRMQKSFNLIETAIKDIYDAIIEKYPMIQEVKIKIKKIHPLGGAKVGFAFIESIFENIK